MTDAGVSPIAIAVARQWPPLALRYRPRDEQQAMLRELHRRGPGFGVHRCKCPICREVFFARNSQAIYCSQVCASKAQNKRRKAQRQSMRGKRCGVCRNRFDGRADARFCGNKCRQAAHRQRNG